ncbi:MAG: glycosyltransferase family 1 protein [Patescibacteria group bacterium]|nr:glycosyltransferase family 1 protein [Patescibacteria group bacterium]
MPKTKLFIEASAICETRISGVGQVTLSTIIELAKNDAFLQRFKIVLLIPSGTRGSLQQHSLPMHNVETKVIHLEKHIFHRLLVYRLLPPMDLLFGKGIYLFPNFKNWPVYHSNSLTYIHDVAFRLYPETVQRKNLKMLKHNVPLWVKRTTRIITVSSSSKQEIIHELGVDTDKVNVVPNGVDTTYFRPMPKIETDDIKQQYGIQGNYLLYVGNIEPRKNISRLLDAYAGLPENLRDEYSLVLVGGGGWGKDDIESKIVTLQGDGFNIIRPDVYVPDAHLPYLYSGASLLTHVALHEGFGLSVLQAMACKTPVLASDIAVLHEVADLAATYVNPLKISDITDKMSTVLQDKKLQQRLITLGTKRVAEYSWKESSKKLVKIIERLDR